jgi:hypothetical protein
MRNLTALELQDQFVFTRDIRVAGERALFFRRAHAGEFTCVRRGVYLSTSAWSGLDSSSRSRARSHATLARVTHDFVLSHESAVAMWRLPWFGERPTQTHVVCSPESGGRTTRELVRHVTTIRNDPVVIDGLPVTSLARTVVDIGRTSPFHCAVVVADAALRRSAHPLVGVPGTSLTRSVLLDELGTVALRHGTARARLALEFADGAADRPGESLSRVNIALAKLPAPALQVPLRGASGQLYFVDFWWPEFDLIGEFDGRAKYSDPEFLRGRSPQQALTDEKLREDDLRAAHHRMTRWMWETAISMPRLRRHLMTAGLR